MSGLGHGRPVDRCVAAFIGQVHLACTSLVGHRTAGYLCGVAERYLHKFQHFFYDLLVRMNHALGGRGSHSFDCLKEVGEQLCDQTMLTFAVGLVSGMAHNLARVSLTSQNGSELPWIRWKGLEASRRSMAQ